MKNINNHLHRASNIVIIYTILTHWFLSMLNLAKCHKIHKCDILTVKKQIKNIG